MLVELPQPGGNGAPFVALDYVSWRQGDLVVAYVPALHLHHLCAGSAALEEELARGVRDALERRDVSGSLERLSLLGGDLGLEVREVPVDALVPALDSRVGGAAAPTPTPTPTLAEVAVDLVARPLPQAFGVEHLVSELARVLRGVGPGGALLVGDGGVGKSAIFGELARRRQELGFADRQFWCTTASRLVAGMTGAGMWQARCQRLVAEARVVGASVHFGNLLALCDAGRYEGGDTSVAAFLRPAIARGQLLAVAECTPGEIAALERDHPRLLEAFTRIDVPEPGESTSLHILRAAAEAEGARAGVVVDGAAVETLAGLHRRFAGGRSFPGRPLQFLRRLVENAAGGTVLRSHDVLAAFARETGLPSFVLSPAEPFDLDRTEGWFVERVMGQPAAVQQVMDVLAAIRARLIRPGRPIASLLFVGPTGVGKTEMAKTLAEFFFGDPRRMLRLDMSEYADPGAAERLQGGWEPAGEPARGGILTRRVREQPFSVVLLDEIEKAHPLVHDLLLQVLGEGRLTDGRGRLADFRNAMVVMTSNLGAESFCSAPAGYGSAPGSDQHFHEEVRSFLRPELYNRIDSVISFAPLGATTVRVLVARELDAILAREGARQRGLELRVDARVIDQLAAKSHDARYGARPLKRTVEREVLAPLAAALASDAARGRVAASIGVVDGEVQVSVERISTPDARPRAASAFGLAERAGDLRRRLQRLELGPEWSELQSRLTLARGRGAPGADSQGWGRWQELEALTGDERALVGQVEAVESRLLVPLFTGAGAAEPAVHDSELAALEEEWAALGPRLLRSLADTPDQALAVFSGGDWNFCAELAGAYFHALGALGLDIAVHQLVGSRGARGTERRRGRRAAAGGRQAATASRVDDPGAFFQRPVEGLVAVLLEVTGSNARLYLEAEAGTHELRSARDSSCCELRISEEAVADVAIDAHPRTQSTGTKRRRRRVYDRETLRVEDATLTDRPRWGGRHLEEVLLELLERGFALRASGTLATVGSRTGGAVQ